MDHRSTWHIRGHKSLVVEMCSEKGNTHAASISFLVRGEQRRHNTSQARRIKPIGHEKEEQQDNADEGKRDPLGER